MKDADVVIIGGGILGSGVAQCASAAGYRVILVDKNKIAKATSSNSSKLIHGGLRYLETAQLKLVYESLSERSFLLANAKDLVRPVKFYIPVYQSSQRKPWQLFAGLSLYYLLSGFNRYGQFRRVNRKEWATITGIRQEGMIALFQYWDAQTDDYLLTSSVAQSAQEMGAEIYENCNCTKIEKKGESYVVETESKGEIVKINAKCVVNAAGPWGTEIAKKLVPRVPDLEVELVAGSHVLLDISASDHILYLESHQDTRVVFVMPWYGKTLVGTTESAVKEAPDTFKASENEIQYLCEIYAHYFEQYSYQELKSLIIRTFCGARVLPKNSFNPYKRSRETMMKVYPEHQNVVTILGGKLTTYRVTAKQTLVWLEKRLGKRTQVADFDKIALTKPKAN
ncbi:FAD-dependent oxidoreductase [Shewanella sp. 202IG2-18]|uniref:glycerol-3-phosphate dehydrogenase/oxidase n=1 Tax=Parashewanella hymeniacidonis TaxID=2807618 RepID=UPI00195F73B8|nr:FAD-dependent oxidoreductase [Parashewanella hymeniacidonis]MBM7071441.1 FAD-dependent oxidoreductase [Parashewanella hymeniacidonis]